MFKKINAHEYYCELEEEYYKLKEIVDDRNNRNLINETQQYRKLFKKHSRRWYEKKDACEETIRKRMDRENIGRGLRGGYVCHRDKRIYPVRVFPFPEASMLEAICDRMYKIGCFDEDIYVEL